MPVEEELTRPEGTPGLRKISCLPVLGESLRFYQIFILIHSRQVDIILKNILHLHNSRTRLPGIVSKVNFKI